MTPNELLDEVKGRFSTLLHNEPENLRPLLKQALSTFQTKAGVIKTTEIQSGLEIPIPDNYSGRMGVTDATHSHIRSIEGDSSITLNSYDARKAKYPIKLTYLVSLRSVDLSSYRLPERAIPLIMDYLEILIKIPNSERLRRVALSSNMDASDIPTIDSLEAKKQDIESQMKESKVSMISYKV